MKTKEQPEIPEVRLQKLAHEKSCFHLMTKLLKKLSMASGLDKSIENMLIILQEYIGGTDIVLYFYQNGVAKYADVKGMHRMIGNIEDKQLLKVFATGSAIQLVGEIRPGDQIRTMTWLLPLKSGEKIVGVLKLANVVISTVEMQQFMDLLLSYAATLLQNEIDNYQKLKQVNDELKQSNDRINFIIQATAIGTWEWNLQTGEILFNENWASMLGYDFTELEHVSVESWRTICHPEDLPAIDSMMATILSGESDSVQLEIRFKHRDSHWVWVYFQGKISRWSVDRRPLIMLGNLQDISARKKSEEKLERSMRLYAVISHIDQAIIHSHDKDKLLDEACRIFVDVGKFSMAWFGVIDRQTHQLKPYIVAGHDDGYLSAVEADITKDRLLVKGPVKTAVEELRYVVSNDIEIDPIMELYRDHSLSRGYRSFITLPLKLYHEIEGTLNLFSNQTGFFNQEEIDLLQEVAEDISYALEAIETEKERKLAAEKLSLSELKYRTIVNSTTEAILIFDLLTERCIEVNQAAVDMYGYTKDEFASMNIDSFSLFDDTYTRTLFFENIRLASDGSPITFEWEGKRRNNQMFWKESSLSKAIIDSKERLIAIDRDIDERKKIMQALRQSEERHRLMFEVADEGIYIAQDYKIDYFNPKMLKFSGYTEQELKEMGFLQLVHPDYRDVVLQNYQRRLMGERVEQNYEIKILRKDGTDCWVTVSGVRLVWNGKPAIFTLMNDISEQKKILEQLSQSEEMYRLITENASDVIWVWNFARNGYTFISPAIRQLRGLTVEEAMAESMQESLAPESRALVSRQLEKSIRKYAANSSDNDPIIMEIRQPCKDGRLSWIEVSARLRINKHHEFELVGVSRNIDERKRMEAEILNNQEKLREAVASKDKFFSIIAHDLKSPFNNVLDFCNLLVEKLENNDYEMAGKFAGIIQEATQRAMNLLVNLLEWSRSQTGRMEFKPEYIEMVALINEAIELNGNAAQQKAINITVNLPETAVVFADAAMINTVLRNLISNAVKFTRPGGEMIISAKKEKHEVQVSVQDNGVGIPKDHIDKLFRIDESMTTKGTQNEKGTGLGLILCKEFVDKHQGNIWVESEEGKGTTFYFTIPTS